MTSFDAIRILRKKLGVRNPAFAHKGKIKIGHAGTLDPNASGLLIIGVGDGTKKLQEYLGLPKTYLMDILLGIRTDTGDVRGRTLEEATCAAPSVAQVSAVLRGMIGACTLPVPAYSALKYKGKPRYYYARRGIAIEPKIKKMEIFSLKLVKIYYRGLASIVEPVIKVEMDCASGTYARSVAEEIGRRLGIPATLQDLRRTRIGTFTVEEAENLE